MPTKISRPLLIGILCVVTGPLLILGLLSLRRHQFDAAARVCRPLSLLELFERFDLPDSSEVRAVANFRGFAAKIPMTSEAMEAIRANWIPLDKLQAPARPEKGEVRYTDDEYRSYVRWEFWRNVPDHWMSAQGRSDITFFVNPDWDMRIESRPNYTAMIDFQKEEIIILLEKL